MPLYMDTHHVEGDMTAEGVAADHAMDLATQEKYGVRYLRYWFDESSGTVFCLVEAPSADAARQVHVEAHGHPADSIVEVTEGT